jgi:uncharacterized OB-fold protein
MKKGVVYTETVIHAAPESFVQDAPYQVAIIIMEGGDRVTARILGERITIDDRVHLVETRDGVSYFRKSA